MGVVHLFDSREEPMSADTLTLKLHGNVPLDLYAQAVEHFRSLVYALSLEVTGSDGVDWTIEYLAAGSALATVRGVYEQPAEVERVVRAYHVVGEHLYHGQPVPYSGEVAASAYALTALLNGHITGLDLVTDFGSYAVVEAVTDAAAEQRKGDVEGWGTIRGELGTVTTRPNLRLTVYDSLFDKAVVCFLNDRFQSRARDAWGKTVLVSGWVVRDGESGRPLKVREVFELRVVDQEPGAFRRARGALPYDPNSDPPEEIIRQLRNGI